MDETTRKKAPLRILIAGTGGQGVLLVARLLTSYFVRTGRQVLSEQLHGMAQRGGCVRSTVIVDCGISPSIPRGRADLLVGFEPVETVRALSYASRKTTVFMNTSPIVPFALSQEFILEQGNGKYPDIADLRESIRAVSPQLYPVEATSLAKEAGSIKALNIVMLGCLVGSGKLTCTPEDFFEATLEPALEELPPELAAIDRRAFLSGVKVGVGISRAADLFEEVP